MKKVLITGGSSGIGFEAVKLFLENNFEVYTCAREKGELDKIESENLYFMEIDLNMEDSVGKLYDFTGNVDVLINNAGVMNTERFGNYSKDKRDFIMNINLYTPIMLSEKYLPGMQDKPYGRIINTASIAAHIGHPDIFYGISKAGLINFTKSLATSHGNQGIFVASVAPGPVNTKMLATIPEARKQALKDNGIMKRFTEPKEVVETIFWLATQAPETMNGVCVDINNGTYFK